MKFLIFLFTGAFLALGFSPNNKSETQNAFYIGRSRDANIIKYDLNLTEDGKINLNLPIVYYWVKNTKGGNIERLSYAQDKLAYGIKYLSKDSEQIKFQFVSYPKRTFVIKKSSEGRYKIVTYINNKGVELKRIHVEFGGGTFFVPKINYVNMYWKDLNTNIEGTEVIIP